MNIEVRYFSRSGNTKKVAQAIAKAGGVTAKDCSVPITEPVDLLFLGGAIYGGGIDQVLKAFIAQLDPSKVKCVAPFGTAALKKEPDRETEKLVREQGIALSKHSFQCRGSFAVMHRGRPNSEDLQRAADFALAAIEEARQHGSD